MNPDPPKRIQEYRIDFGVSEVYECGAALVSLLAIPRDDELDSVRSDLCGSLCAFATAVIMDVAQRHGVKATLWELVLTREVIEAVVREAERYEVMLQKSSRLNIGPESLVRLRVQN
jgi:hypothetical protein